MKIVNFLFLVLITTLVTPKSNYAQGGSNCAGAAPFCTGTTYQYDNNINTSSQSGPNYGCLLTTPNPSWYWMQIGTAGNIDIAISQTTGPNGTGTGIDVDFIMWGPFTSATGGCSNLTGSNDVDCSYSAAATETANITGAVVGQYYLLLLTNYSNQNGYVTFAQSGGNGATNCSVVSGCTATVNNAGPFCAGSSITMSTSGQANATNYTWTGPNSFSQSGAALTSITIPNATPAMAGTYTLTITRSPGTPCVLTTAVVVNSTTATFSSPSTTQCLTGNSFNFTHTGTAGATHTWNFGGATANTSTAANPTGITYAAAGTYVVTHVATANGCARTQTMSVVVNPMPALTGVPANASCGANNGSIFINNTSAAGQGPFSFTNNGTAVGSQTVTGLAPGTYNIGITNTFGCTVTTPVTVGTNAGPTNITLTPSNATCGLSNGSFTFASPVGGTGPYTYAFNGGAFTATSPINGLAAGTYSITVRDVNGCLFTKTVVVASGTGPSAIAGTSTPAGCGLTNGTYNVTGVTGGTAAYTFSVDGVATGSLTSNLAPGTHNITVVDGVGCSFNTTFVIGSTTGPTSATINSTNASCGIANGTSTISAVVGGTPTYSFSFDGGPFVAGTTGSGLTAGAHNITIRDANSCTVTIAYNVLNNGSPNATIVGSTAALCNGASNGSFTVSASGGSGGPYSYTLTSNSQTNSTGIFNGLAASIYTVIARDNAGCTTTATVSISQPAAITLTPTAIAARCFATATGTINIVGGGGTPAYTYNLNGGAYQASSSFNSVGAAIYNMGIRDANGCTATQTVQVTQPTALVLNIASQNANCTAANGIATTTVSGGTGPTYTYTWTGNGGAGATSNGVVSGNYSVTVTDANGCSIVGAVNIGNTPGGTAIITASTNITCNGANNGNLTASMIGGTPNFTYNWSPSGQTTAVASNLAPGTHTCIITDNFGCISSVSATLIQPTVLSAIMNSNNVKCFGTPTGTVSAAGTGGTFPYTYSWPGLASTFATVPNVAAANYTCIITDANNCSITQSITVTQPTSITLTSTVTPATCNLANGSATVTASGGTGGPAYTYSWSTSSTPILGPVAAGTYTVEVKDANNCIVTLAATIPNSSGPSISSVSFTNAGCFGANTGVATAFVTGGSPGYTYNWNTGQNTATAGNLLAGVHTVTVTDANGCVASASVTISEPLPLTVNLTPTNPKCFGATNGGATAIALGGTPSYTYAWTDGGTSSTSNPLGAGVWGLTVTDAKGCVVISTMTLTNPPQMFASITSTNVSCFNASNGVAVGTTTNSFGAVNYYWTGGPSAITGQTVTSLTAGTYTLLATDQNSCTAGAQVIITQPTQLTANITSSGSVTCNGGADGFAVVTAGGGTPTYTYTWSGAASASGNSSSASNLPAGVYSVTVLDANGCSVNTQITILQPTPLATTLTTTNPLCNGNNDGTANIAYSGGAGTTHFLWEPSLQSGPGANFVNNLSAGSQTVTITTNGSCSTKLTFTLTQPAALTAIVTASNSNCGQSNGRVCATVGGGTGGLSVLWSNNVNTLCNNNIPAGAYNLVVTDANGCTINASGLVNDIAGPSVSVISSTNVKCFGGNDGTAIASITAGTGPYTIFWTGGATTQTVTNFNNGIKNITVTDAANCIGTASVAITEPPALASAVTSFTNVTCNGLSNGSAVMAVNFGTPNYNYTWTPGGQTSAVLANVVAGTYTCNVLDANGCATSQQVTISQPAPLVMTNSLVTNITCNGLNNGQISTTILGGTPGYTYTWVPAQAGNSGVIGSLSPGPHNLTVTDSKTCSISANFNITEPPVLTSNFTSLPARCEVANGSASVTVNGGTPGYSISWNTNPVISGSVAVNLGPGSGWSCVITDSKSCSITQTVNVANAPSPLITGYNVTQPTCFGLQNGSIVINYTSGTPSYSVTWPSPISQTQVTSSLSQTVVSIGAGVYTPTVTDSYGCVASVPVGVAQPSKLVIAPVINSKICYGGTAQIFATGTNGTAPYTYTWSPGTFSGAGPHTVTPTLTTVYNVAVSDANGCTATPTVITVNVTPQLTVDGYSVVVCDKSSVTLVPNITSVGNGAPYDFIWSNGVTHLGATSTSITVAANYANSPNTYSLTVKDNCTLPDGNAVFTVSVNPLPIISFTAPVVGCAPLSFSLTATSNGANDVFTWKDTINTIGTGKVLNHVYQDAGKYNILLSVFSANGCESKLTKLDYIEVFPQPIASFYAVPPLATILNPNFDFVNTSQGATSYYWDFGDPVALNGTNNSTAVNPSHGYSYVGEYKVNLVATSNKGCVDIAYILVEIAPDFALYIPNAFTPDGNNVNDIFQPVGVGIDEENYRMDIFDRWGENIFTSNNFRKGWDGSVKGSSKTAPQGVYTYKLMVKDTQGNKHPYVGHVTVIRENQ
jgi:gliding motility-associated-like protein